LKVWRASPTSSAPDAAAYRRSLSRPCIFGARVACPYSCSFRPGSFRMQRVTKGKGSTIGTAGESAMYSLCRTSPSSKGLE